MNNIINELKKKNHLLDESKKKIKRYNYIISNFQNVSDNVYSKIELYNDRINNLPIQINELEKDLIIILKKILTKIINYMENPNNNKCIMDTEIYIKLKNKIYEIDKMNEYIEENEDRKKIYTEINNLHYELIDKYKDIPFEIKDLFSKNILIMEENKKYINGQEYLTKYINLSHPELKETYQKFIIHYELLKNLYNYVNN